MKKFFFKLSTLIASVLLLFMSCKHDTNGNNQTKTEITVTVKTDKHVEIAPKSFKLDKGAILGLSNLKAKMPTLKFKHGFELSKIYLNDTSGKEITEDCMKIRDSQGKCNVGEAVITRAGNMPFKNVIHTVGPVWQSGKNNEKKLFAKKLLKKAYISSLELAEKNKLKNISFPNISTGVYRFPKDLAAKTAINAVIEYLEKNDFIEKVNFVCFEEENFEIYRKLLEEKGIL